MARRGKESEIVKGWTESKYWSAIRTALRSGLRFYPPKVNVLNKAKRDYKGGNPRQKYCYECASCGECFKADQVQVDHLSPCGSLLSYDDLPDFVETLYCGEDNLQVLCKSCHKIKGSEERKTGAYRK
jgi:5-methylcytosine-specific restriction endonuclease McrA